MRDTGVRAADHLDLLLKNNLTRYPATAIRRTEFLIPPVWGCTLVDPARSIYQHLCNQIQGKVRGISLACGFPLSDVPEAGPAIVAYGFDETSVNDAADSLLAEIEVREGEFSGHLYSVEEAVTEAIRLSASAKGPVILTDNQDFQWQPHAPVVTKTISTGTHNNGIVLVPKMVDHDLIRDSLGTA